MALRTGAVVVVSGRPHEHRVVRVVVGHGEMTERPNVAVLKTAVRLAHRGFESLPLRCCINVEHLIRGLLDTGHRDRYAS